MKATAAPGGTPLANSRRVRNTTPHSQHGVAAPRAETDFELTLTGQRFVDDGRMRLHEYAAAAETEGVQVGDIDYEARRIDRVQSGDDRTVVWVARDVPLPVRIHMQDGDDAPLDLMLIQYQGATP